MLDQLNYIKRRGWRKGRGREEGGREHERGGEREREGGKRSRPIKIFSSTQN